MKFLLLFLLGFQLHAGVTLKKLNYKLYFKWVTPELEEIVEAYQKLFTKIDENLKTELKYIPWRGDLYYQYRSLLNTCSSNELSVSKCSEKIQSFKAELTPFHTYWNKKYTDSNGEYEKKLFKNITNELKPFLEIKIFNNMEQKPSSYPKAERLLSLYTLPYPYLISRIKDTSIKEGVERLWGNIIEPIISKLLYRYNLAYLTNHIDKMNLQINETRMIWMKRAPVASTLQKSINYMHFKWNIMLKSILKF